MSWTLSFSLTLLWVLRALVVGVLIFPRLPLGILWSASAPSSVRVRRRALVSPCSQWAQATSMLDRPRARGIRQRYAAGLGAGSDSQDGEGLATAAAASARFQDKELWADVMESQERFQKTPSSSSGARRMGSSGTFSAQDVAIFQGEGGVSNSKGDSSGVQSFSFSEHPQDGRSESTRASQGSPGQSVLPHHRRGKGRSLSKRGPKRGERGGWHQDSYQALRSLASSKSDASSCAGDEQFSQVIDEFLSLGPSAAGDVLQRVLA